MGRQRVLVAYASKHGSTAAIAETIARELRRCGLMVDCEPAAAVEDVTEYDGVILGSAIYVGRWLADGQGFLRRHEDDLVDMPVWLFSSGPIADPEDDEPRQDVLPSRIARCAARIGARGHATFGGALRPGTPGVVEHFLPKGDWRDQDRIRGWADLIAADLGAPNAPAAAAG